MTVTTVVPTGKAPDGVEYVIVTALTASVAVAGGGYVDDRAERARRRRRDRNVGGHDVITGGVVSRTVIVNVFVLLFPWPSRAVTVIVVVPSSNIVPDAWEYVIVIGPTASVAFANA